MKAWWLANNKRASSLIDGLFDAMMILWLSGIVAYVGYITSHGELIFMGVVGLLPAVMIIMNEIRGFNRDEDLY